MQMILLTAVLAAAFMIASAQGVRAQQSAMSTSTATGSVSGVLNDPSGVVIAGARAELRSITGNFHEIRISDHLGHFSFISVPPGNYQLTVIASGFASQVLGPITVAAGAEVSEDLFLKIAVMAASVQVEGQDAGSIAASDLKVQASDLSQSHNTAEMLADLPGISLHGNGELATIPFLHGLGDERTKIMVDGMTISSACPNHMNPTLGYVALLRLRR